MIASLMLACASLQDSATLIERLGNSDIAVREEAYGKLEARLGEGGGNGVLFRALKKALGETRDEEIASRLRPLLRPWSKGGIAWERDFGVPVDSIVDCTPKQVVLIKRHKVAEHAYPCELRLCAVRPLTGELLWESVEPIGMNPAKGAVVKGRYVCTNGVSELIAFDLADGKKLWSRKSRRSFSAPLFKDDRVYLGGFGWLTAHDAVAGDELWARESKGWVAQPISTPRGLLVGALKEGVMLVDPKDGGVLWRAEIQASPVTVLADQVIVNFGHKVGALALADGKECWMWEAPAEAGVGRIVAGEKELAVESCKTRLPKDQTKSSMDAYDFRLSIIELETGKMRWTADLGEVPDPIRSLEEGFVRCGTSWYRLKDGRPQAAGKTAVAPSPRFIEGALSIEHDPPEMGKAGVATKLRGVRQRDLDVE